MPVQVKTFNTGTIGAFSSAPQTLVGIHEYGMKKNEGWVGKIW